ncbi:hypothetical protein J7E71_07985 [Mesobacillus foraminis]|uniref:DUF5677 domain-containing protein n=1 Tax=Mesobacillus foraminis TaxID=279826 RepID=UPI001BEBA256|nr:DUF5677 domain-containing protein [Mesobacillus foraminis]MBT2755886.1 hypothetical protein [Mesobacillus foraminis]
MDILTSHKIDSRLKWFLNDFVTTYLEKHYLDTVSSVNPISEVQERALFFYVKTINTVKSINTLFNSGDIVSARVLMRGLFELKILLKKLNADKEEFIRFSKAYEKFKVIEALKFTNENLEGEDTSIYDELFDKKENQEKIIKLQEEITELGFIPSWNPRNGRPAVDKYFEIKEIATSVDEEYLYKSSYKNLCMDTHTSPGHFYKYFLVETEGKKILNLHPYLHELDLMIVITVGFLMNFFEIIEELLGVPTTENLAYGQFQKLFKISYSILPRLLAQGKVKKMVMDI